MHQNFQKKLMLQKSNKYKLNSSKLNSSQIKELLKPTE